MDEKLSTWSSEKVKFELKFVGREGIRQMKTKGKAFQAEGVLCNSTRLHSEQ